jgi:tRNA threonylcarbamoyladenosine biosynthesis protein TsaE
MRNSSQVNCYFPSLFQRMLPVLPNIAVMTEYTYKSDSPEMTFKLGKRIGEKLSAGTVIALIGELGCGKTVLTRGICDGLEVPLRQVNSPTFILVNEYRGRMPVFHMDMYQLNTAADAVELGVIDYLNRATAGVMIVEWAERILPMLPEDLLRVYLRIISEYERFIEIEASGEKSGKLLREMT